MAKAGARSGAKRSGAAGEEARERLIEGAITVLARDGFAQASARAIAAEAGGVNGLIFYHFGSMDQLLAATARRLSERRIDRVRTGLGGDEAAERWAEHLGDVIRDEATSDEGRAVVELLVGSRGSPALAEEVRASIDRSVAFAADELRRVLDGSPLGELVPTDLVAELATAAFLGLEILTQNDRHIDIDAIARLGSLALQVGTPPS